MSVQIYGSELAEDRGWSRSPVWRYDPGSGYLGNDRVGEAFGARYVSLRRHLDLCYYVAIARFPDGGARYSVARTFDLSQFTLPHSTPIEIPKSFYADEHFTYPGKLDCDSAIRPFQHARRLALEDLRTDALFWKIVSL